MSPRVPIIPQGGWNLAKEIIIPTGWDDLPPEPPLAVLNRFPVAAAPPPQDVVDNEPTFFPPRGIDEWLNDIGRAPSGLKFLKSPKTPKNHFRVFVVLIM
ncbi:hypothetical protein Hanom_Chr17g01579021 [Helianthus anomalus]